MPLSKEEKIRLIKAYEPILYLHPDEALSPVQPEKYVESAALWCVQPAGKDSRHNKDFWGQCKLNQSFPHEPLIPKNGISVNSAEDFQGSSDPDGDGVNEWYMGHQADDGFIPYMLSDEDRMLFLDNAAWRDSVEVSATSLNEEVNVDEALAKWQRDEFLQTNDWYYAEVDEINTLEELILGLREDGLDLVDLLKRVFSQTYVIWYYFLFPLHRENMRGCEEVLGAGSHGNYEGDWQAIGVIVPKPDDLDNPESYPEPLYVSYGQRARGLVEDFIPFARQYMDLRDWSAFEVRRLGLHPKVYVAKDTHNFYANSGPHEAPSLDISNTACGITVDVDEAIEEIKDDIDDAVSVIVTIAKIGAGCGIGAVFGGPVGCGIGAIVGGIAALIEAGSTGTIGDPPGAANPPPNMGGDNAADEANWGDILVPQELVAGFPDAADATDVRPWRGNEEQRLVDREAQVWWPQQGDDLGYNGRWGVMCQEDTYDRRSGIEFPDFKRQMLLELAINLSEL